MDLIEGGYEVSSETRYDIFPSEHSLSCVMRFRPAVSIRPSASSLSVTSAATAALVPPGSAPMACSTVMTCHAKLPSSGLSL